MTNNDLDVDGLLHALDNDNNASIIKLTSRKIKEQKKILIEAHSREVQQLKAQFSSQSRQRSNSTQHLQNKVAEQNQIIDILKSNISSNNLE